MMLESMSLHFIITYEYSSSDSGASRNDGQVKLDKSPVKEANDFKKRVKLPLCSTGTLSSLFSGIILILSSFVYKKETTQERRLSIIFISVQSGVIPGFEIKGDLSCMFKMLKNPYAQHTYT